MKALSIRQPWAWLIVHGFKPVENRTWNTKVRGPILIHASKGFDKAGYDWVRENFPAIHLPHPQEFERGGIVGVTDLYAVATVSNSPWFSGPFGFCLKEARRHSFVPMLGRLGFFEVQPILLGSEIPANQPPDRSVDLKPNEWRQQCAN